jgi:hypothetical protein
MAQTIPIYYSTNYNEYNVVPIYTNEKDEKEVIVEDPPQTPYGIVFLIVVIFFILIGLTGLSIHYLNKHY